MVRCWRTTIKNSKRAVDGLRQKAVVISPVRSNTTGELGFWTGTRRMNLALTRECRRRIVTGDSGTLVSDEFYARPLEHFERS